MIVEHEKKNQTWKDTVQNVYSSIDELESYDSIYGIAKRCGYDSYWKLWEDNPMIGGSTNPADFGLAED
jgi:hypothetical protein